MIIIPINSEDAAWVQSVQLEGRSYQMRFYYVDRTSSWYGSIRTAEGDPIISGQRLTASWHLWANIPDTRLPPGVFLVEDLSGQDLSPGRDDLGTRVELWYLTAEEKAEVEAIRAAEIEAEQAIRIVSIQ